MILTHIMYLYIVELCSLSIPIPFSLRAARVGIQSNQHQSPSCHRSAMVRLRTLSKVLATGRVALCLGQFDVLSTPSAVEEVLVLPISATVHYTPCRPVEKCSYSAILVIIPHRGRISQSFGLVYFLRHSQGQSSVRPPKVWTQGFSSHFNHSISLKIVFEEFHPFLGSVYS